MKEEQRTVHALNLTGREKLDIQGVNEVHSFDDFEIELSTVCGELTIYGESLNIENLNLDSGELSISGFISSLSYSDVRPSDKKGVFSRLFK